MRKQEKWKQRRWRRAIEEMKGEVGTEEMKEGK